MIDCPSCEGTGIAKGFNTIVCDNCAGHGEVSPYRDFYKGEDG